MTLDTARNASAPPGPVALSERITALALVAMSASSPVMSRHEFVLPVVILRAWPAV